MKMLDRTKLFQKYQNKWVALTEDDKVISAGDTLEEALNKANKKGFKDPIITKISDLRYEYIL